MLNKINIALTFKYAILEAVVFAIPVVFFIRDETYRHTWLLFLGSFFFMIITVFHNLESSRKSTGNEGTSALIFKSLVITIAAIVVACLLCFILLMIMVPGLFGSGQADKLLTDAPPGDYQSKTNGMGTKIFLTAVVANFSVGAFAGVLMPFYSTRNREGVSGESFPLQEKIL